MTLRHMKILVEVYRQNSVTKAAQALHLSQPSVSLALRELEDYYGVTLFERVGRRISPTECGREFYGYAVHVVSLMDELETRMRNWDAIGTVRIGATVTIGTYLLPELVRRYQAEFPALHVDVQVRRASQVEQLVLDNRIDLGLIETQPEHEELVAVPFSRDELQAIVPPSSPLAGRGEVTIQELAQYMKDLGCVEAYNLDGGMTSCMYFNGSVISTPCGTANKERSLSDIIYIGGAEA